MAAGRFIGGAAAFDPVDGGGAAAVDTGAPRRTSTVARAGLRRRPERRGRLLSLLQVAPLALVLAAFLVVPIVMIAIVSLWKFTGFSMVPALVPKNYQKLFGGGTALALYLNTARLLIATYAATLVLGYLVAYHLAFDIRRPATQT